MIKACLNGSRTRDEHPAVPYTPDELVAEAVESVAAGASAVHVHPGPLTAGSRWTPGTLVRPCPHYVRSACRSG
ncbi:hypothetical protein GCM10029964_038490 [Kibdelosporangium lantanae]